LEKLKRNFFQIAVKEYTKRLSKYCKLYEEIISDERADENFSQSEIEQVKIKEGIKILNKIKQNSYVIVLDLNGSQLSSEELAEKINSLGLKGNSDIIIVIGGSNGLSEEVLKKLILSYHSLK